MSALRGHRRRYSAPAGARLERKARRIRCGGGKPYDWGPQPVTDTRYLDGDPDKLRTEYLGKLGYVCHLTPRDIDGTNDFDGLTWLDFYRYVVFVDSWMEIKTTALKAGVSW